MNGMPWYLAWINYFEKQKKNETNAAMRCESAHNPNFNSTITIASVQLDLSSGVFVGDE